MVARGSERQSSWPSNIVLTIVLALLAGQQAFNNFNNNTASDIAVLKEQMRAVMTRCSR